MEEGINKGDLVERGRHKWNDDSLLLCGAVWEKSNFVFSAENLTVCVFQFRPEVGFCTRWYSV